MRNPVGWFVIHVQDMPRARAFYESVFNVQLADLGGPDMEMWAFPMGQEGYGSSGALVIDPEGNLVGLHAMQ